MWQWQTGYRILRSTYAKLNLLAMAIEHHDRVERHTSSQNELFEEGKSCFLCMVNVALQAMDERDLARATIALDRTQDLVYPTIAPYLLQSFVVATARLRELQRDTEGADEAYRDAIAISPLEPKARMGFALFLARQGKIAEARKAMDETLPLWPPNLREERHQEFERTLAAATKSTPDAQLQH